MKSLIIDTETTGLIKHPSAQDSVQPQIIEWAGLLYEDGETLEELDVLINPGCPLPEVITKITGLTDEDLRGARSFVPATEDIVRLFVKADVLIAHNLPFDKGMLELVLKRIDRLNGWPWPPAEICTVAEHTEMFGYRPKLTQLYEQYMGRPLEQSHRALDDCRALLKICVAAGIVK